MQLSCIIKMTFIGISMSACKLFNIDTWLKEHNYRSKCNLEPNVGTPVLVVTGASVTEFKSEIYFHTATKSFFPGSSTYLMNVSLPFAVVRAESGLRSIIQCSTAQYSILMKLISDAELTNLIRIVPTALDTPDWWRSVDDAIATWAKEDPVSRIDLLLYDSYTADVSKPFVPIWEENVKSISSALEKRINFYKGAAIYGYTLALSSNQTELRILAITALASYRSVSYLFADGAHKALSSKFLQTLAIEMSHHLDISSAIIELCPGVVDTGLYDPKSVREVAWHKAEIPGFPFDQETLINDLATWPMISPQAIAEIGNAYLTCEWNNLPLSNEALSKYDDILKAGRGAAEVQALKLSKSESQLPLYAYYPHYPWDSIPMLKKGYTPVFLTPKGQMV